ncbi:T9SS type A sorting domain-containing protein [Flavivirga amylovorans]|uniref:T9SS type A sorting domain-containing protein n=1 Tax=Flavivirga amylovorans TaxID=870486 RepID=A0ABT8X0W4_9FLAO|nr:T9SS type A sorting domain-containing protein [Flavivirga amylovorans]MDO5987583.1 T9SS type A sorting domain-containing protein [Flavivirga amylovorans]
MKTFYFLFLFVVSLCSGQTTLNPGEIMITGYYGDSFDVEDGCGDSFAFVSYVPLLPGTTIRFSEEDFDQWATGNEGDLVWENNTGNTIAALTNINIITSNQELTCGANPIASIGLAQYEEAITGAFWSLSTSNEEIIVFQGTAARTIGTAISVFLTDGEADATSVPPSLLGTNFITNFNNIDDDLDVAVYDAKTTFNDFNDFVTFLTNAGSTWATQDEGGGVDNGKDGIFPDYPDDLPEFAGNLSTISFDGEVLINAYPNPVKNKLVLQSKKNISSVIIHNSLGKEVYKNRSSSINSNIDMSDFQSGIYFIKVFINDLSGTIKVVKI